MIMKPRSETSEHRSSNRNGPEAEVDGAQRPRAQNDYERSMKDKLTGLKQRWTAVTGVDRRTYMQMFKGALAPTVAIAAYQATSYADTFTTIGYLVGVMAVLSFPIQPRAKFMQTMLVNLFATCLGCAVTLLAMYCSVTARLNTESNTAASGTGAAAAAGIATSPYNPSASAVAGIWLFAMIYAISAARAEHPQFTIPSIVLAIFANVSMVYAPQFSSMALAQSFAQRLLEAFLTGFAISTACSLIVFPLTSRQVVFKDMSGYIVSLRGAIKANLDYIHSLEETDVFAPHRVNTAGEEVAGSKEADAFKDKMRGLAALHAKTATDLPFAKREVAIGRLGPDDLQKTFRMLRIVMLPVLGLSCMSDVFQRIAEERGWDGAKSFANIPLSEAHGEEEKMRIESVIEWHELMKRLREPFESITNTIDEGLEHVAILLQLVPTPKRRSVDEENNASIPKPGEKGFSAIYDRRAIEFLESKKEMLRAWCAMHDIELPGDFFDNPDSKDFKAPPWMNHASLSNDRKRLRRQLFMCLYMEFLLFNTAQRVGELMLHAEELRASGKLGKNRVIVPGYKRLRKWVKRSLASREGEAHDDQQIDTGTNIMNVYPGEAYKQKKDPEHLPPANAWERASDLLRAVAHFLASPASNFGARVACATLSIAIVGYLRDTQTFATTQRIFWAQIMISISMNPSAGQSLRNFVLRILGTFVFMLLSWVAYYIVDGETAGVLVFYFIFLHLGVYIILKRPEILPVGMIGQITITLILGYELQVRQIGVEVATSNGQAYYPIYILAPIRLATVCGGLFLAWIWTVFPYPITEHSQLRQGLGRSLYLLANYYSGVHESVRMRLRGGEGDITLKDSPGYQLDKARQKVYSKCSTVLTGLRTQASFVKFDIPIGGKFPRERYQAIISQMQSALDFMVLISLASSAFDDLQQLDDRDHGSEWLANFRRLVNDAHVTSETITTLLALMSASVSNGSALPPYLRVPEPYQLTQRLDEMDQDILSVRHIAEPGYSSFAVIQIGTKCMLDDLRKILAGVKELVGELDFSYHVVSTANTSREDSV
ncbi:hypothetical protein KC340_g1525 [Hortaea werneckii]|nr:hypothetical protein KC342_g7618 [Hortaea werneckii]KAI7108113.1 hypothetical protein KC339_g1807 [Hortaea werneckii]KAI7244869.1 hypothetical protein KC365_g1028 [Hortaea werneckii]KAI7336811.1 hypothetical protein KC340_g1525 [Hortaea werneckii]KAI7402610.1 hypothetical protein KC328_g2703 [Hortaea werneckii]